MDIVLVKTTVSDTKSSGRSELQHFPDLELAKATADATAFPSICFNGMAFWPRDEREKSKTSSKRGGLVKEQNRDYPYLEPGLMGAATLSEKHGKLDWTFLSNPRGYDKGNVT